MSQAGSFTPSTLPPGSVVEKLTGNTGGPVGPDSSDNINVVGDGTTIDIIGNPGTHTLTASVIGGNTNQFDTDSGIATPVAGVLNVHGGMGIEVTGAGNTVTIESTGVFYRYINVNTTPYFVLETDVYLSVDTSTIPITILLPDGALLGEPYIVKDRTGNAATNNITITTVSDITNIDGGTSYVMDTGYQSISIIGNGTSYELY
jgi:hypothetical protein